MPMYQCLFPTSTSIHSSYYELRSFKASFVIFVARLSQDQATKPNIRSRTILIITIFKQTDMLAIKTLLFLSLLLLCHSDEVTRTTDYFGTVCQERSQETQRVQRLVNVTYTYPLQTARRWQQFPDMKINFYLAHKQFVSIKYHLSLRTCGSDFFKSRVVIDGRQNPFFRYVTGYLYWRTHSISQSVLMEVGWHEVKVEYDQSGGNYNMVYSSNDWAAALFLIEYFDF